ncbi:MAG TPA: FAD/NAD(P)-binding protein [Gemmatales bacterium]|nr:FAD/NAD(P)-binding protein [Gemmatales bacterium]
MTPASNPWQIYPARLASITEEIPGVATYDFEIDASFNFEPGQFNMLYMPGVGEAAISLSGRTERCLSHTIKVAGNVTRSISLCKPGSIVGLRGPFGTAWPMAACLGKDILLVAGGIGLAPVRPVIHEVMAHPQKYGKLTVLHGARYPSALLYTQQHADWREAGIPVETIVDHADTHWQGQVGVITQLLQKCAIERPAETILLTCGPEVMMHYAIQTALARGLSVEQVYLSLERHMNCAIGHCGHCQLGPAFVCKEGPVFRYDRISPFLRVEGL